MWANRITLAHLSKVGGNELAELPSGAIRGSAVNEEDSLDVGMTAPVQVSLTPLPAALPRTPSGGVGEAPRHEVAGHGGPSVQRALRGGAPVRTELARRNRRNPHVLARVLRK
jgi:hypothetical protein